MGRHLGTKAVVSLLLAVGLGACPATTGGQRPTRPPPVGAPADAPKSPVAERLANGARLLQLPSREDAFRAALLFAGGPLEDPPELPGLTGVAVEAAMLGTHGDPAPETNPPRRALEAGARLIPVSDGSVFGWAVVGPADSPGPLLALLHDLAARPSFAATRFENMTELARESREEELGAPVMLAVAVAVGVALGRRRPVHLEAHAEALERITPRDVARHWKQVARPERAVLVLAGGADRAAVRSEARRRLEAWRPDAKTAPARRVCLPAQTSTHVVAAPTVQLERASGVVALMVPGRGEARRALLEVALAALGERTTGRFTAALGEARAWFSRPRLLDLGWAGGTGASVLLIRTSGIQDLGDVLRALADFVSTPPTGAELVTAQRQAAARRLTRLDNPLLELVQRGRSELYPSRAPAPGQAESGVDSVVEVDAAVVVGVGPPELGRLLARLAPVTIWNEDGERAGGARPPGCRRGQGGPP